MEFDTANVVWALGSFCALNQRRFDADLFMRQAPPPYDGDSIVRAARAIGFGVKRRDVGVGAVAKLGFPCLAVLRDPGQAEGGATRRLEAESAASFRARPAIIVQADGAQVSLFRAGTNSQVALSHTEFERAFTGVVFQLALTEGGATDPDGARTKQTAFGFWWFAPELLKHRRVWRDVLVASLVIQLLAL